MLVLTPHVSALGYCREISTPESYEHTAPSGKMTVFKTESIMCLLLVMRAKVRSLRLRIKCAHPSDGNFVPLAAEHRGGRRCIERTRCDTGIHLGSVTSLSVPFLSFFQDSVLFSLFLVSLALLSLLSSSLPQKQKIWSHSQNYTENKRARIQTWNNFKASDLSKKCRPMLRTLKKL